MVINLSPTGNKRVEIWMEKDEAIQRRIWNSETDRVVRAPRNLDTYPGNVVMGGSGAEIA